MPGIVYQPTTVSDRGAVPDAATIVPAATLEVPNSGKMWLRVTTTGNANITIANKTTADGLAGANLVVAVNTTTKVIGPFAPGVFNNVNGNIEVAINTPANVSAIEATQLP